MIRDDARKYSEQLKYSFCTDRKLEIEERRDREFDKCRGEIKQPTVD